MKSIFYFLFHLTVLLVFIGCSNPGYAVRINIDRDVRATEKDIDLIKSCLRNTTFEVALKNGKDFWKVESYKIILDNEKFKEFEHNNIFFAIEYYYDQEKVKEEIINKIEIRIGNNWNGRNFDFKNEIDKIADCVLKQLKRRFDASNISVTREYTSPV